MLPPSTEASSELKGQPRINRRVIEMEVSANLRRVVQCFGLSLRAPKNGCLQYFSRLSIVASCIFKNTATIIIIIIITSAWPVCHGCRLYRSCPSCPSTSHSCAHCLQTQTRCPSSRRYDCWNLSTTPPTPISK